MLCCSLLNDAGGLWAGLVAAGSCALALLLLAFVWMGRIDRLGGMQLFGCCHMHSARGWRRCGCFGGLQLLKQAPACRLPAASLHVPSVILLCTPRPHGLGLASPSPSFAPVSLSPFPPADWSLEGQHGEDGGGDGGTVAALQAKANAGKSSGGGTGALGAAAANKAAAGGSTLASPAAQIRWGRVGWGGWVGGWSGRVR